MWVGWKGETPHKQQSGSVTELLSSAPALYGAGAGPVSGPIRSMKRTSCTGLVVVVVVVAVLGAVGLGVIVGACPETVACQRAGSLSTISAEKEIHYKEPEEVELRACGREG